MTKKTKWYYRIEKQHLLFKIVEADENGRVKNSDRVPRCATIVGPYKSVEEAKADNVCVSNSGELNAK